MKETAIMIAYKDRPTELAMLLCSLYTQIYKDFDIYILDDQSGTPLTTYHFFNCVINLLKCQGFKIYIIRTEFPHGVSKARQRLVDEALKKEYKYLARVDDDVYLESDFLERLIKVIETGYDLASGVTPPMVQPTFIRNPKYVGEVINYTELDTEGNITYSGDSCGMNYTDSKILLAPHFRSSALYKVEIHKKVNYTPTKLSKHGFREENIFSWKCILNGFKLGVDTGAVAWHQQTPSGGERFPSQNEDIQFNQKIFEEETKEMFIKNGDFLRKYYEDNGIKLRKLEKTEYMKEENLMRKQ